MGCFVQLECVEYVNSIREYHYSSWIDTFSIYQNSICTYLFPHEYALTYLVCNLNYFLEQKLP